MRFTRHYSGSTVCAPSRSCLMTGQHTGHALVRGNARIPLRPEDTTIAEVMKGAGYATGIVGKWGLGEPGTTGVPNRQGFDHWFGYLNQRNAHNYYPDHLWRNEERHPLPANEGDGRGAYTHDLFTEDALQFTGIHDRMALIPGGVGGGDGLSEDHGGDGRGGHGGFLILSKAS